MKKDSLYKYKWGAVYLIVNLIIALIMSFLDEYIFGPGITSFVLLHGPSLATTVLLFGYSYYFIYALFLTIIALALTFLSGIGAGYAWQKKSKVVSVIIIVISQFLITIINLVFAFAIGMST